MNGLYRFEFGLKAHHLLWKGIDWLYPPTCASCDAIGERWCSKCRSKVIQIKSPVCRICGDPIKKEGMCDSCTAQLPPFTAMRSWSVFDGSVRDALHSLKYKSNLGLGEILAQPLFEIVLMEKWPVDMVVPIPLSKEHLKSRGYNQSACIARPLALRLQIDYQPGAIKRIKETTSQIKLSAVERYANLQDAFCGNPATLKHKKVLLLDDVTTTGATMKSCADAVRQAGASEIYCLTVARALKKYP